MIVITNKESLEKLINERQIVLLMFYADWYSHKKNMFKILNEIEYKYQAKIAFASIEIEEHIEIRKQYQVKSLPHFIIIKNNEIIGKQLTWSAKILEDKIQKSLYY